ncbi:hypothetical protein [Dictyobacter halimunensis]
MLLWIYLLHVRQAGSPQVGVALSEQVEAQGYFSPRPAHFPRQL